MTDVAIEHAEVPQSAPSIHYSYFLVLLDILLRWTGWSVCFVFRLPDWGLWLMQIAVGLIILFVGSDFEERVRARAKIAKFAQVVPPATMMPISVNALGVLISAIMIWRHVNLSIGWLHVAVTVILAGAYAFYLAVLWPFSLAFEEAPAPPSDWKPADRCDQNDYWIIHLDAEKECLKQKIDTYTLESALFGALAFSAFVTIIASERKNLDGIARFLSGILSSFHLLIGLRLKDFAAQFTGIDEKNLFAVIAFDTLICSLMFLAVIICRLRFTTLMSDLEYLVRSAESLNHKEEQIRHILFTHPEREEALRDRLDELTRRIEGATEKGRAQLAHLSPVVAYMSGFRTAGVIGFLAVLTTSAMWVDLRLAVLFSIVGTVAVAYPQFDELIRGSAVNTSMFDACSTSAAASGSTLAFDLSEFSIVALKPHPSVPWPKTIAT